MSASCPHCQSPVHAHSRYCPKCGRKIEGHVAAAAPVPGLVRKNALRDTVMGWLFLILGLLLLFMLVFGKTSFWPGGCLGIVLFVLGLGWLSEDSSSKAKPAAAPRTPTTASGNSLVLLNHVGDQKIQIIKVVREYTGLGLKEAKDLVESAPATVLANTSVENAGRMKSALEACGAQAEVR
jgi:large subunit ribosomal protein L7/L12